MIEYRHISVMNKKVVDLMEVVPERIYYDATLGGGGHSEEILKRGGIVVATDLDSDAIFNASSLVQRYKGRFFPFKGNFKDAIQIVKQAGFERVDGVVADLGFSSYHIENPARGFSFSKSGPLDMRYDRSGKLTAYQFLSQIDTNELAYGLENFADIKRSGRLAEYIKRYFIENRPDDTVEFADYLRRGRFLPHNRRIDPVTKIFMAIRIMVNDEIGNLTEFIVRLPLMLRQNSVVAVITFHSVEDRIVKNLFRKFASQKGIDAGGIDLRVELINKKVILPDREEILSNPRARSAKLRVIKFLDVIAEV